MIGRVRDWRARMAALLARHQACAYAIGISDCFIMCAELADSMLGTPDEASIAAAHCGCYSTNKGALRRLRQAGFVTLSDWLAAQFTPIAPAMARVGDLGVARDAGGGEHLAVCIGTVWESKTAAGRTLFVVADMVSAGRVG